MSNVDPANDTWPILSTKVSRIGRCDPMWSDIAVSSHRSIAFSIKSCAAELSDIFSESESGY